MKKNFPSLFNRFSLILCFLILNSYSLILASTVCSFDTAGEWKLSPIGKTTFQKKAVTEDGRHALEVSFDMARPNLNSKDIFTGFIMDLKKASFSLSENEALSLSYKWEGNENHFRIEVYNANGFARMKEFTYLHQKNGWQEIIISNEDMEIWGSKALKGEIGKVKALKMVVFYSWDKGPGKIYFDELKIIKKPVRKVPVISVSQLGYRPNDPKRIIVNSFTNEKKGYFNIVNIPSGEVVFSGMLEKSDFSDWKGSFFTGDFSEFKESASFQAEVSFNKKNWYRSGIFKIEEKVFDKNTARLNYEFIMELRADEKEIFGYPELGAYRDAGTMLARYMGTNTHMIYGLASYLSSQSTLRENAVKIRYAVDELKYGVESLIKWQLEDGSLLDAVVREPDLYLHNQYPEDNTLPWKKVKGGKFTVLTYIAAMSKASVALRPYDKKLADKALKSAIRAYKYGGTEDLSTQTKDVGNAIWDAMELYKATNDVQYLNRSKALAEKLLKNQFLDFTRTSNGICGNFSNSSRSFEFSYQYKLIHNAGIYFGLIELIKQLDKSSPLYTDIRFALKTFKDNYLTKMSNLTPYMQIAEGLETNEDGTIDVMYFHPPTGPLGTQSHGLNCDHLAYALMGVRLAEIFNDKEMIDFASNQVQWIFGVNPLGVSMMSGVGYNQAKALEDYLGLKALPGGIVNGIVGDNGIRPFWAGHWVSGEYWVPHTAYYTALIGELENFKFKEEKTSGITCKFKGTDKINGEKKGAIKVEITNNSGKNVNGKFTFRARGSHSADEKFSKSIGNGKSITVKKDILPSQLRSVCYLSLLCNGKVIAEEIVLPKIKKFKVISREDYIKIKPIKAEVSSEEKDSPDVKGKNAIDANMQSRWSSEFSDPQTLTIDYGEVKSISMAIIHWENAYGKSYILQYSKDAKTWKTGYSVTDEDGGKDEILFDKPLKTRYIRLLGKLRGTPYGYSVYELEAYKKK